MGSIFGWGTKVYEVHDLPRKRYNSQIHTKNKAMAGTITYEVKKQHEIVESGSLYFDKGTLHWEL